jgi:hypothetical protein
MAVVASIDVPACSRSRSDLTPNMDLAHEQRILGRVHQRLTRLGQTDSDKLRKTDSKLPAVAVMLFDFTPHESIGILIDDRNAERTIS